jgi:hypothetical protein
VVVGHHVSSVRESTEASREEVEGMEGREILVGSLSVINLPQPHISAWYTF